MSKVFTIADGLENMGAIKTGGQGSVYKGRRTGEIITAVKLLPTPIFSQSEEDPHYRDFLNEVKKLQRVAEEPNPNVVKMLSYGISESSGFPFIEMEYIDGPDLVALLKPPYDPVFNIKEVLKAAEQLSAALAHCHKLGVKHGDIKPNNIRYNRQTRNFVLLDFGLAALSDEDRRTSLRQAGAIEFVAPEQNEGKLFFETDVYSFGIVLFELLAGRVPFPLDGNSVTARNKVMLAHMEAPLPDVLELRASALPADWPEEKKALDMQVPGWLVSTVYKCLQKRPGDRFANGTALHDFILNRHIYATEAADLATHKDDKWQAEVAKKEYELQDLKAVVSQQEGELKRLREKGLARAGGSTKRRTVSKSLFGAALAAFLLAGALAVYGLFFRRAKIKPVPVAEGSYTSHDTLTARAGQRTTADFENGSKAEKSIPPEQKTKAPGVVKVSALTRDAAANASAQTASYNTGKKTKAPSLNREENAGKKSAEKDSFDFFARYKVRGKAHFYTEPDESTRRPAFITHWNNAILKPLDEQDGFVYTIFTNFRGETSRGWLLKADLIRVE